jgi:carbon storage regulator CsrA
MLIISRKPGQSFACTGAQPGDAITVHLLELKGSQMVIGIEAPKHIRVERDDRDKSRKVAT